MMVSLLNALSSSHDLMPFVTCRAKEKFVLISADGPDSNVIKIKPPMCFAKDDADLLLSVFHQALNEVEQEC